MPGSESETPAPAPADTDVLLIGSGIMSANLGAMLRQLDPALRIQVVESTPEPATESSHGWHNAGTGHAGICELSYTPSRGADGRVDVSKAVSIFGEFEQSRQFWSFAVAQGMMQNPGSFIRALPHISFVHGREQVEFLRDRHQELVRHHFFESMEFTTDPDTIRDWAPLLMEGRGEGPVAATRMAGGTDVNFGEIARQLLNWLGAQPGCSVKTGHRVTGLKQTADGWEVEILDQIQTTHRIVRTRFVFIGAGGGTLPLLQKSGIPEAQGLGGFPIAGQWMVCRNPEVIAKHSAKVYGQALDAAPTMAVPHLDTRMLDGKKSLLFGPFAAWTTRFLHSGRVTDLPFSMRSHNLATLFNIGVSNLGLVKYLVQQGTRSMEDRMKVLRVFYPAADPADWTLTKAGIRVQAVKRTDGKSGIVHYGTEILTNHTGSLAALLGASPGASVSVNIALGIIRRCFPDLLGREEAREKLAEMIPDHQLAYHKSGMAAGFRETSRKCTLLLGLDRTMEPEG